MNPDIITIDQAKKILDQFNYFHDSVIKKLSLISHDTLSSNGNVDCTGEMDIIIVLLFYDLNKNNFLITVTFKNTKDIYFNFRGFKPTDWGIDKVTIKKCFPVIGVEISQNRLALDISWDRFDNNKGWFRHSSQLFTFESAVIEVAPAAGGGPL